MGENLQVLAVQISHFEAFELYTVVRCAECGKCWGVVGKTRNCPHCGNPTGDNLQIVSVAENASDLQREVAVANMPENLRDELKEKLPRAIEMNENPSASLLYSCIRTSAIDDVINLDRLSGVLRGKGISVQAEEVAEEAVAQGLLIRRDEKSYLLLQ